MKLRPVLVLVLIFSLAVLPSLQLAMAASTSSTTSTSTTSTTTTTTATAPTTPFTQKLTVYTVGTNDFFLATMAPVNVTKTAALNAESVSGINAYEITEIKSTAASASSQLFWQDGYKVLHIPFVPDQGAFVNITATSQAAAQTAVLDFDTFLGTNLQLLSTSGNNYTYFAPDDFGIGGDALFSSVPAAEKGLATVYTADSILNQPTPTMILTGVRTSSGFAHTISFGSTETHGLASNGTLNLAHIWNVANSTLETTKDTEGTTTITIHALDGLISTPDTGSSPAATVTNDPAAFTSTYAIQLQANSTFRPNVTILADPPVLSATRSLSTGSAANAGLVSVTLVLANTASKNTTITNVSVNDNWWTNYPSALSLSSSAAVGNTSFTVSSLGGGKNVSLAYVLKVTGSASQDIIIPPATVSYTYTVGNLTIHSTTKTNEDELRLNDPGPALEVQAGVSIASGSPVGTPGTYAVRVTNVGTSPALDLSLAGFSNPTLVQGATWQVNSTVPLTTIVDRNTSQTFSLSYTQPDGSTATILSNPATLILSHSGILIPFMQFDLTVTPSAGAITAGSINATYILTNAGTSQPNNVTVSQTFASGMTCASAPAPASATAACTASGAQFSLTASSIATSQPVTGGMVLHFARDNYMSLPALITTKYYGLTLVTEGTGFVVPAGITVTKSYVTAPIFLGEDDRVLVKVTNIGTLPILNISAVAEPDNFATTVNGSLDENYPILTPGATDTYNFTVNIFQYGNQTAGAGSASYDFGGFQEAYTATAGYLLIYSPVKASTAVVPSNPEEGKDFSVQVSIVNPSPTTVQNVQMAIPIPSGLTIVNYSSSMSVTGHNVTLSIPSMAARTNTTTSITLVSRTDGTFNFPTGKVTFQYLGVTVPGTITATGVAVNIDILVRYELPIGVALIVALGTAAYIHRKLPPPQGK